MKSLQSLKFLTALFVFMLCAAYTQAQSGPEDGTYFIVNVATGRALTPVDGGINSNTRLKKFNKSGMQKWKIKKYTAKGKEGKMIVSYTIQNAASGFYLRPYFVPDNHEAILSDKDVNSSFSIEADAGSFIIKSIKMGGDALHSKNTGFDDDEPWFGPDEKEDGYRWQLVAAE
ncbi:RICIN domain-containing protein [Niabella beijingensis]|uniref:RICIN domain-containing protein n=1 Tax=Niabella beijingensis TaxID=2872700 RepID=UPI001CBF5CE7|nr:RICIN domain-containing protein [Niabella beijingensis]MBZ4189858.1 RICIN domain-containing protein [Niabella beijingensis]